MRPIVLVAVLSILALAVFACSSSTHESRTQAEENLQLTFGGFPVGHPEEGKIEGVCTPNPARNALNCDIYNGLTDWDVTEVRIAVTWAPYDGENKRFFNERVSIASLQTERISIRLGLQLPPDSQLMNNRGLPMGPPLEHWGWTPVSAKGHRKKP